jgi:tetratricopeptide (TPR) repeat protein
MDKIVVAEMDTKVVHRTLGDSSKPDDAVMRLEVSKLEILLPSDPDNLDNLCRLSDLYMGLTLRAKAKAKLNDSIRVFLSMETDGTTEFGLRGMLVVECAMRFWRGTKYSNKDILRINFLPERIQVMNDITECLKKMYHDKDAEQKQKITSMLAFSYESTGKYQEALSLYSDLITMQAMEVEITHIIMRAAVLLKHIGGHQQAIEYLEFLVDDPPVNDGYSKTHVLGFLAATYETAGDQYAMITEKTYGLLLESYTQHMAAGKKPLSSAKKMENILAQKSIKSSSEIYEMLALQAVDKCEYVFACEVIKHALIKVPNKGRLQHLLAEVYLLLDEKDKSIIAAEKAFALQPFSAELRNLLLIVAREKWQDKLRSVASSRPDQITKESEEAMLNEQLKRVNKEEGGGGGLNNFIKSASSAMKTVQTEGIGALVNKGFEQMNKEAEEKAEKKREKLARKERRRLGKEQAAKDIAASVTKLREGPARPLKPIYREDQVQMINTVREGNTNKYVYDPILRQLAKIIEKVEIEKRLEEEKKRAAAVALKPARVKRK